MIKNKNSFIQKIINFCSFESSLKDLLNDLDESVPNEEAAQSATTQKPLQANYSENNNFKINTYFCEALGVDFLQAVHSSGFQLQYIPKSGFKQAYFSFYIPYGSNHLRFRLPQNSAQGQGKDVELFQGAAHYLEHCIFDNNYEHSLMNKIASLGVSVNAYTGFDHTLHYGKGASNMIEAIKLYASALFNPRIDERRVEEEREIISSELAMYDDSIDSRAFNELMTMVYENHPCKYDIGGTQESIAQIRKEDLQKIVDAFYIPAAVKLLVVGDFNFSELCLMLDECIQVCPRKDYQPAVKLYYEEKDVVCRKSAYLSGKLENDVFWVAVKDKRYQELYRSYLNAELDSHELEIHNYKAAVGLELMFSDSGKLYNELYYSDYLNDSFNCCYSRNEDTAYWIFSSQSDKPEESAKALIEAVRSVKNDKKEYFDVETARIMNRYVQGRMLQESDDCHDLIGFMLQAVLKNLNFVEYVELCLNTDLAFDDTFDAFFDDNCIANLIVKK